MVDYAADLTADAKIVGSSDYWDINYGSAVTWSVGYFQSGGKDYEKRSVFSLDLAALTDLTDPAQVTEAHLHCYGASFISAPTVKLRPLAFYNAGPPPTYTPPVWAEGTVTWNTPWVVSGGDIDPTVGHAGSDYAAGSWVAGWNDIDATNVVKATVEHYGKKFNAILTSTVVPGGTAEASCISKDEEDATYRPELHITYTVAGGGVIKKIVGLDWASVKVVSGVAEASVKKVAGVVAN